MINVLYSFERGSELEYKDIYYISVVNQARGKGKETSVAGCTVECGPHWSITARVLTEKYCKWHTSVLSSRYCPKSFEMWNVQWYLISLQTPLKSWIFQASIRNCKNCVRNYEDHSLLDFISAVQCMVHFIYNLIIDSFLTGTVEPTNDQLQTSVASYLSWLEHRTGITRSRVQTPLKSWIFQASLHNCKNCVHNCEDRS